MKNKLILAILFSLTTAVVFARGGAERAEDIPEKLVYLSTSWGAPSQELINIFEEKTGITVEVVILDPDDLRNKVMTAATNNSSPADIIFTGMSDFGVFSHAGVLKALDKFVPQQIFDLVVGQELFQIENTTLSVPIYQQMVMLDYNKAALNEVGLTAVDIKTWSDLEQAALKLKANGMEYPLAFGARPWSWYMMALSQGGTLFDNDGNLTFDQAGDPGYKAFVQLVRYFTDGLISPERLTSPNPHPSFWSGQAAFHQAWQGSLAIANNPERSEIASDAGYLLLPDRHYTWNLPAGISISSSSKYPQASLMFIEFMLSDDVQTYAYTANGMYPASKSTLANLGSSNQIDGSEEIREQAKYLRQLPYDKPWFAEFEAEARDALVRAASGNIHSERALLALAAFQKDLKKRYE